MPVVGRREESAILPVAPRFRIWFRSDRWPGRTLSVSGFMCLSCACNSSFPRLRFCRTIVASGSDFPILSLAFLLQNVVAGVSASRRLRRLRGTDQPRLHRHQLRERVCLSHLLRSTPFCWHAHGCTSNGALPPPPLLCNRSLGPASAYGPCSLLKCVSHFRLCGWLTRA